jgi:nucleotide-binding universal stress UspA family protein
MKLERILVATDLSAEAAWAEERGAMLAQQASARLDLVHVVADTWLAAWRAAVFEQDADTMLAAARAQLFEAAERFRGQPGSEVACHLETGVPYRVLLDTADRLASDLVVAGAHGRHPLHALVIGSVAEKLLYRTQRPLLVAKRAPREPYRRVLAAVDFSPPAAAALRFAARFAHGAQLTLYHAVESPFEGMLQVAGVDQVKVEAHRRDAVANAEREMRQFVDACGLAADQVEQRVAYGYPIAMIESALEAHAPDLLVLGKHGRSAVERWLVGSVTAHMVRVAQCDVLVVPMAGAPPET